MPGAAAVGALEDPSRGVRSGPGARVDGGWRLRVDGQGIDVEAGQAGVDGAPGAAAIGGLEDALGVSARVEGGRRPGIDGQGGDIPTFRTVGRPDVDPRLNSVEADQRDER